MSVRAGYGMRGRASKGKGFLLFLRGRVFWCFFVGFFFLGVGGAMIIGFEGFGMSCSGVLMEGLMIFCGMVFVFWIVCGMVFGSCLGVCFGSCGCG